MKIQYFGTGAGAGIPEIFCSCRVCENARANRGKNIRTRSQAIIDDRLSIDYPVDTFMHTLYYGLDMRKITNILITHAHYDHFLQQDVFSRAIGMKETIHFYASEESGKSLKKIADDREEAFRTGRRIRTNELSVSVHVLEHYTPIEVLDYKVTPVPAHHAKPVDPLNYIIQSGDKSIFWGHDTGRLFPEVYEYIKNSGIVFDFVSLDCTLKRGEPITKGHMDLDQCIETVEKLREKGNVTDKTVVVISHIGHLVERTHDELAAEAAEHGIITAYDGMVIEI